MKIFILEDSPVRIQKFKDKLNKVNIFLHDAGYTDKAIKDMLSEVMESDLDNYIKEYIPNREKQ